MVKYNIIVTKMNFFAAYHRDLLIKEANLDHIFPLNNIEQPEGFIRKMKRLNNHGLPQGIFLDGERYCYVSYNLIIYCSSYEEAVSKRLEREQLKKDNKLKLILSQPIKRDDTGVAIIELFNRKREKVGQTQVDDDLYHHLMTFKWYLSNGYVRGQNRLLSRYIMNCNDHNLVVDHIDHNRVNNRKSNLRICTYANNNQNKLSIKRINISICWCNN